MKPLEQALVTLDNVLTRRKLKLSKEELKLDSCEIFYQGNFTGALINGKYLGMTKRNCNDDQKSRRLTGRGFAISRAVHALVDDITLEQ